MKRIAVFPGSFDPITLGHCDIINRALPLFDKIIVAIGQNSGKNYMFSLEQRKKFLHDTFSHLDKIEIDNYEGLTVDYCLNKKANFILRGLRNPADFEFEKAIAHTNRALTRDKILLETVFLLTSSGKSYISSSIVRDVIRNNGDYTILVPEAVKIDGLDINL
ncbi:pantetheine-phosphate adenylyltransferase [Weeksellaceae bacterium TAE3-ERU29]|nr:pantetheine-phosphate adenylyltransferase [Weeksellaceae bacterium TAE3-ERU29]